MSRTMTYEQLELNGCYAMLCEALRTGLQKRGTRSARRRLKSIGNRENRWMRDVNHQVSNTGLSRVHPPLRRVVN